MDYNRYRENLTRDIKHLLRYKQDANCFTLSKFLFLPLPPPPYKKQDFILAELLRQQQDWIVKYHEHDSLLENVVDESLTEEERKVAWSEYEAEKEGRMLQMANPDFNVMPGMVRHDKTNLQIIDDQNKCVR